MADQQHHSNEPPTTTVVPATSSPFLDLMTAALVQPSPLLPPPPVKGLTENLSPTFLSTGNPCLDLFFHAVPSTPSSTLIQLLNLAWARNPLTALKLLFNLRGVRGTGKSDKEGFYTAALWLHSNHPKTLACNVAAAAEFGYFKDLPEILYRLLEGPEVRDLQKAERQLKTAPIITNNRSAQGRGRGRGRGGGRSAGISKKKNGLPLHLRSAATREERIAKDLARAQVEKEAARTIREQKRAAAAKKATDRYNSDPNYRFLHDQISELFAECLKSDLKSLNSGELNKIGLAAKWCPSLDSSFDRSTLLCQSIARRIFPPESVVDESRHAFEVRERLRKEVLVPLRRALGLPEVYMSANRWDELPYNRVASVAMKTYKKLFLKHDEERFRGYLAKVESGEAKIAAGALLPHEVIAELYGGEDGGQVAELQWKRIVEDLSKEGKMKNCIPVCDVSGSMSGTPMEVCVALGLLVSELSEEPWKGKVITFSENPQLHLVVGQDLRSKIDFIRKMDWGMNTDFQKVFDTILQVAVAGGLKAGDMLKRVLVFSDMEFDQASSNPWETDYEAIKRKFSEKGYEDAVPEVVFWNLRDSSATPVTEKEKGVAMVSGFSKNLLKIFLNNDGEISPLHVMEAAIMGKEYQKLVVFD